MSTKSNRPTPPAEVPTPPLSTEPTQNDLDRLREILYGGHARTTEQRLHDLEAQLQSVQRTFTEALNDNQGALTDTLTTQLAAVRDELAAVRAEFLAAQQGLTVRLEQLAKDQAAKIQALKAELTERMDEQKASLEQQINEQLTALDTNKVGRETLSQAWRALSEHLQSAAESISAPR